MMLAASQSDDLHRGRAGDAARVGSGHARSQPGGRRPVAAKPRCVTRSSGHVLRRRSARLEAAELEATDWSGEDVIIVPAVSDEDARKKFPAGFHRQEAVPAGGPAAVEKSVAGLDVATIVQRRDRHVPSLAVFVVLVVLLVVILVGLLVPIDVEAVEAAQVVAIDERCRPDVPGGRRPPGRTGSGCRRRSARRRCRGQSRRTSSIGGRRSASPDASA